MTLIRIKTRHRQVFSKWWNSNTPSNIGLQFTVLYINNCDEVILQEAIVRCCIEKSSCCEVLEVSKQERIMYHVLNFMSQYCYHSVLALQPRNTMLSLLEEATMDWWLQVTLQDVG